MNNMASSGNTTLPDEKVEKLPIFKTSTFQNSAKNVNVKKKAWRSLKQIITLERALQWPENFVHYSQINAPPSFRPAKKYSDISGLVAPYTEPQTRLQYATIEEYQTILTLPTDITAGYLALRGATNIVG